MSQMGLTIKKHQHSALYPERMVAICQNSGSVNKINYGKLIVSDSSRTSRPTVYLPILARNKLVSGAQDYLQTFL